MPHSLRVDVARQWDAGALKKAGIRSRKSRTAGRTSIGGKSEVHCGVIRQKWSTQDIEHRERA
jgi:hypothetical protein